MNTKRVDVREHLYAIFGNDISHLPRELEIAARHHRELATGLRHRAPDELITEPGARHLADGHDRDAARCDRIAGLIRHALGEDGGDFEPNGAGTCAGAPGTRWPRVVTVTSNLTLRSALDVAAHQACVRLVHHEMATTKARKAALSAALVIVGVEMASWFTGPVPTDVPTVVIGFDPLDRSGAADHAHRLHADLFVLQPPGHEVLIALLRKVSGEEADR